MYLRYFVLSICCRLQRCRYGCMCPIHGRLASVAVLIFMAGLLYGSLWSITGEAALPGGNLFALSVLFVCCYIAGVLIGKIRLPPLLGEYRSSAWFVNITKIGWMNMTYNWWLFFKSIQQLNGNQHEKSSFKSNKNEITLCLCSFVADNARVACRKMG